MRSVASGVAGGLCSLGSYRELKLRGINTQEKSTDLNPGAHIVFNKWWKNKNDQGYWVEGSGQRVDCSFKWKGLGRSHRSDFHAKLNTSIAK